MFFLSPGESGPRVVLVQSLLRLKGINVRITGHWDSACMKSVGEYRTELNLPAYGSVTPNVFFNLIQGCKLKVIDAVDASAGSAAVGSKRELEQAGIKPLMNPRVPGHGVAKAVDGIVERSKNHQIGLLRLYGHGNGGHWISIALGDPYHLRHSRSQKDQEEYQRLKADWQSYLDYSHYERHRPTLSRITPFFANFGSVEIHSCTVGSKNQALIRKMAETWGVPVTAGMGIQSGGQYFQNRWGEWVPEMFVMEGEVFTAYPRSGSLKSWAATIEASVPNWVYNLKQFTKKVTGR